MLGLWVPTFLFAETIILKSGKEIEGKIIEKTDKYIKLDFKGILLTYYVEDIESIDGIKQILPLAKEDIVYQSEASVYSVNDNTNAANIYESAASMLTEFPDDFKKNVEDIINNGWVDNNEGLKELLVKNQEVINEFSTATKLANCDFSFGKPYKDISAEVPNYSNKAKIARLVIIQARLYERENKLDAALDNYLSVLRFANHLGQQKDFIMLSKLMESVMQDLVCPPLSQYINSSNLGIQDYQFLLDTFLLKRDNKASLEHAFEEEKKVTKNAMWQVGKEARQQGKYNENFYLKFYKEIDVLFDEFYGYLIVAFRENKPEIYTEKIGQFINEVKQETNSLNVAWESLIGPMGLSGGIDSPSLAAKILVSVAMPQFSRLITRYYASLSELNILTTATAIKLYKLKNGKIPDSLEDLVPEYLPQLFEDPFNNFELLKYKKINKEWVVYSLGPDKQDNQGSFGYSKDSLNKTGDIVFSSL